MELRERTPDRLPDFALLKQRFDNLPKGAQADLRRARHPDEIADLPAYYRWLGSVSPSMNMQRIAYIMPHVAQDSDARSLGRTLGLRGVSEMRMFQMLRSDPPRDLEHLRRLVIQIHPALDWNDFGKTLYYWGPTAKRRILRNYFTPERKTT